MVGDLQARAQRLYEIVNDALKYRAALCVAIRDLSAGKDRALVLAGLDRWDGALKSLRRGVKRL